eukprot:CAMPEP_0198443074 /NCGR_PEP_ID=MMETSP1452-20131203/69297_1 /TAXON_ID=1181717 /ORGANISM="Synchroma pusillum, Strain CCMP3072" /LENGTH=173 /DNA_ID=CAMNT_0044163699 /DNA_START=21 /DNA_END=539 /DNA_ORIENTATION=+
MAMPSPGPSVRATGADVANAPRNRGELPSYAELINYPRSTRDKHAVRCVMCGLGQDSCVVPRQNKGVCKTCDVTIWRHCPSGCIMKFCKGCKKFLNIDLFGEKTDAAKCERCRERGRKSYIMRKRRERVEDSPAPSAPTTSRRGRGDAHASRDAAPPGGGLARGGVPRGVAQA